MNARRRRWLAGALLVAAAPTAAQDRVPVRSSAQLHAAVESAKPGLVISLAPGTYAPGLRFVGVAGSDGRPIVIEGADSAQAPVFSAGACALHLVDCRYVTLRNQTVTGCFGNGINLDDGGSLESPAHHIILENVTVLDTGPKGNHDSIKLSGLDDFAIRHCHRGVVEDCTFEGKAGSSPGKGRDLATQEERE